MGHMGHREKGSTLRKFIFALIAISACIPAFGFDAATPPEKRNALLFSWDGVQREHLKECLKRKELPNIAALIKEGRIVDIDITSHQTSTKPGHVQMLTGYDPDVTGCPSNGVFKTIPEGLSIFERLQTAFGKDKIATIMITGGSYHLGSTPPAKPEEIAKAKETLAKMGTGGDPVERERLNFIVINTHGEPYVHVARKIDFWDGNVRRNADVNGPILLDALERHSKGRFFAFCHFRNPDHAGHAHGENSREYNDALIECDRWVGEAVKKLKALGIYDRTMVFATTDHGFDEGLRSHKDAPRVYLIGNMKSLCRNGDQRDIVPTLLAEMGLDYTGLQPKYKGKALTR